MTTIRPGPRHALPAADDEIAGGRLVIDASYSALSPHLRTRRVAVSVDGYPWRFAWGRTPIDLPPGRHLVEIEVEHGAGWGSAREAVPVAAGNTVEVFYRAPALPRVAGTIGPMRQRTPAFPLCVALLTSVAVLALLAGVALLVGLLA